MEIWFDHINSLDVLSGRDIEFIIKDDGYVVAQTIEYVDELIESGNVLLLQGLGSLNGLAVRQDQRRCILHPFTPDTQPGVTQNSTHGPPAIRCHTQLKLSLGTWIKVNLRQAPRKGRRPGYGQRLRSCLRNGLEAYAEQNPDAVAEYLLFVTTCSSNATNEVTTIAAFDPDVHFDDRR